MPTLAEQIDALTQPGELYTRQADGTLTCYACGHRCRIKPGRRGICQVRFNAGGELRVPWGYVGALQCDPTEKKPFFHVFPGSDTLTFGMLGCDLHCPYCFPGDTMVFTQAGPLPLAQLFDQTETVEVRPDAHIAYPTETSTISASGQWRRVRAVFKHPYAGELTVLRPYYLPPLRCTPNHRVYATLVPQAPPQLIHARDITPAHYLALPKPTANGCPQTIDVAATLAQHQFTYRVAWDLTPAERAFITEATTNGETSRAIGAQLGKSGSYIRHVRRKLRLGLGEDTRIGGLLQEGAWVRFPNEHRPGLPANLPLDEALAELLGYYCAEGSAIVGRDRPNSYTLSFSFALRETALAARTQHLLQQCLGLAAAFSQRPTTLAVMVGKSSAGVLFKTLCGGRASEKQVPPQLFQAPPAVQAAFVQAFVTGDGHRYPNGKTSLTTISRTLAYGVAWLALQLGHLPSVYDTTMPETGQVQGRTVRRAPHQYTVVWYENATLTRHVVETATHYLVPLRAVETCPFAGDVFNMEVEDEHSYLAGLLGVSNCQNWVNSQSLRDPASELAGAAPTPMTPQQLVALGLERGAQVVASSYNEPLITSEWAAAVFKEAQQAGLACGFVSNGNVTPEVLEYLRPYLSVYKIDLKTMSDRNYRRLGAVLQNVLDGVRLVHEMGIWLEIVTLVIPGFNDSNEELMDAARFIAALSPDIPWHVTAFHQDYKMTEPDNTTAKHLIRAAEIGQEAGLRYVYAGNLPGSVGDYENTYCPHCQTLLVERVGYTILGYFLTAQGTCPQCQAKIAGVWAKDPATVRLGGPGRPRMVRPAFWR